MQLVLEYLAALKNKTWQTSCKVDSAVNSDLNNNNIRSNTPAWSCWGAGSNANVTNGKGLVPTCLDDELGAFITWEQGDVHTTALHISRVLVHDGVQLSMAHCEREGEGLRLQLMNGHSVSTSEIAQSRLSKNKLIRNSNTETTKEGPCGLFGWWLAGWWLAGGKLFQQLALACKHLEHQEGLRSSTSTHPKWSNTSLLHETLGYWIAHIKRLICVLICTHRGIQHSC